MHENINFTTLLSKHSIYLNTEIGSGTKMLIFFVKSHIVG